METHTCSPKSVKLEYDFSLGGTWESKIEIEEMPLEEPSVECKPQPQTSENTFYFCATTAGTHKCKICNFETNLKIELLRHSSTVHKKREFSHTLHNFRCTECNFESFSEITLHSHNCRPRLQDDIDLHPEETESVFNFCTSSVGRYKCKFCDFETNLKIEQLKHTLAHKIREFSHNLQCLRCPKCAFESYSHLTLEKHNCSPKSESFELLESGKTTAKKSSQSTELMKNGLVKHPEPGGLHACRPKPEVKMFECEYCPYRTSWKYLINKHKVSKHLKPEEGMWFECTICGYKSRHKYALKSHLLRMHIP